MSKDKSAKIPTPQPVRGTQDMLGDFGCSVVGPASTLREALPLAQAAAAASEKVYGADNYQTLVQRSTIASIHDMAGRCTMAWTMPVRTTKRASSGRRRYSAVCVNLHRPGR